jgi:hypothetical protein
VCEVPFEGDYCQGAIAIKVDTGSQKIWFGTTHLGTVTDNCATNTRTRHVAIAH